MDTNSNKNGKTYSMPKKENAMEVYLVVKVRNGREKIIAGYDTLQNAWNGCDTYNQNNKESNSHYEVR